MEREVAWKKYSKAELSKVNALAKDYIDFISQNKTERECCAAAIKEAEKCGYIPLAEAIARGKALKPGSKVWATSQDKALMLVHVGKAPLEEGVNILGAHIDSPRLDIKQNPLYEKDDFALLDTHYYGGIKKYQWVTLPLAIHGVIAKKDGTVVPVVIGEDEGDPVFCVTDLLPHLGAKQLEKQGKEVVEGEDLDILIGNRPALAKAQAKKTAKKDEAGAGEEPEKDPVKAFALSLLEEKYGITEEDFLSAELEVVPAGPARELGFDRSMVLGYGQDDRVCAYTSLVAQLELAKGQTSSQDAKDAGKGKGKSKTAKKSAEQDAPEKTAVCILVDKEEIGSVGATGMESLFFENTIAEVMALTGEGGEGANANASAGSKADKASKAANTAAGAALRLHRALAASKMLSSDVSAGIDPAYESVFEPKNAAYLGRGLVFNKFTGARGKSGSNDTRAEFVAEIRRIMDDANVSFQTAELGKVDIGGGGTIAFIPARYGMDVIDSGVAVLSMHAPWEVTSKADIYEAMRGYLAFLQNA